MCDGAFEIEYNMDLSVSKETGANSCGNGLLRDKRKSFYFRNLHFIVGNRKIICTFADAN
jgi:hypothetical protein